MQFNTALGFLFVGSSILLLTQSRYRFAGLFGFITILLGLLTLIQYVFGVDLRIDQLFMNHHITTETLNPGRMAPNTALSFTISGITVLALSSPRWQKNIIVVGILGSIVATLGAVSFFGYVGGIPSTYGWGNLTRMAIHTSAGFMIAGLGLVSLHGVVYVRGPWKIAYCGIPVGAACLIATVSFWQALTADADNRLSNRMQDKALLISENVQRHLESQINALERMAIRWDTTDGTDEITWRQDAKAYIDDFDEFQAISWIDTSFHVRRIEPLEGNESALGLDLTFEKNRYETLLRSRETGLTVSTPSVDLVQGGRGFLVFCPIGEEDSFDGFIVGVFRIQQLFDIVAASSAHQFVTRVEENGDYIYTSGENGYSMNIGHESSFSALEFLGNNWSLEVIPTQEYYIAQRSRLPEVILITGILILCMAIAMFYLVSLTQVGNTLIRLSAHRMTQLLNSITIGIIVADDKGVIASANPEATKLFGYTQSELEGESVDILLPKKFRQGRQTFIERYTSSPMSHPKEAPREIIALTKDGAHVPIEITIAQIVHSQGSQIVGSFVDISRRKKLEADREKSRKLVSGIVENSGAVVYVKSVEGRYLLVNSMFLSVFGLKEIDVVGKKDEDIFPAHYADKFREADSKVASDGIPIRFEEVAPQGEVENQYISTKFPIRDEFGKIYAVAGISTDITELKAIENALRTTQSELAELNQDLEERVSVRTAELEDVNKELDQFTYVASHDLQEPLRKQQMFTDVLNEEMGDELSEDAKRAMRAINSGAERMQNLIQSLLSLSRARSKSLNLQHCSLGTILDDALSILEMRIEDAKAVVTHDELPELYGDRILLGQVFQNLIGNAIHYQEKDVEPKIHVTALEGECEIEVAIRDNGIGIESGAIEAIFMPFKRLHTRAEYDGTGVGLSLCERIVERHGGRIWVESTPGSGSIFKFTIPTNEENESDE